MAFSILYVPCQGPGRSKLTLPLSYISTYVIFSIFIVFITFCVLYVSMYMNDLRPIKTNTTKVLLFGMSLMLETTDFAPGEISHIHNFGQCVSSSGECAERHTRGRQCFGKPSGLHTTLFEIHVRFVLKT